MTEYTKRFDTEQLLKSYKASRLKVKVWYEVRKRRLDSRRRNPSPAIMPDQALKWTGQELSEDQDSVRYGLISNSETEAK